MKNPTRIDDGKGETLLHIEITLDPLTHQVSITGNTGDDPVIFTYVLASALQSYMQRTMANQTAATPPAHKRLIPVPNGGLKQ